MDDIRGLLGLIDTGENDRRAAIQQGLLATGLGLLGSRNPRFAGALGEAGLQGIGAYQQHMAIAPQQRIQQLQVAFQLAKMAEEQKRRAALQKAVSGLPEDQRLIAEMAPDEFAKAKAGAMFPKPSEYKPITRDINMGGEVVSQEFDPATRQWKEIARGPRWNPNPAAATQINLQAPTFMVGPDGQTVMVQPSPKGGAIQTPLPGLKPQKQGAEAHLTEAEAKGTLFYSQMDSAEKELASIVASGYDPTKTANQIGTRMAQSDWTNWAAPRKTQQYAQATEQWAEAYLRLKTGAATTKDEIRRNARAYFPQPGDSAEVIAQKDAMRKQAISDVSVVAGRGMEKRKQPQAGGVKFLGFE